MGRLDDGTLYEDKPIDNTLDVQPGDRLVFIASQGYMYPKIHKTVVTVLDSGASYGSRYISVKEDDDGNHFVRRCFHEIQEEVDLSGFDEIFT